jgi:hypothetical protein
MLTSYVLAISKVVIKFLKQITLKTGAILNYTNWQWVDCTRLHKFHNNRLSAWVSLLIKLYPFMQGINFSNLLFSSPTINLPSISWGFSKMLKAFVVIFYSSVIINTTQWFANKRGAFVGPHNLSTLSIIWLKFNPKRDFLLVHNCCKVQLFVECNEHYL